jgi:predicted O-methyltransferase YrrM
MIGALTLGFVLGLYEKYFEDLKRTRESQRELYQRWTRSARMERSVFWRGAQYFARTLNIPGSAFFSLRPQLDDIESEITYMLVREARPATVVEISPSAGWSSSWLLRALKDNGSGMLVSFDVIDDASRILPSELKRRYWKFVQGDVRRMVTQLPDHIEYLFMDSDHSELFAHWYIETIVPRVRSGGIMSVHDVFHTSNPCSHDKEGGVIVEWLARQQKEFFTASPAKQPKSYEAIMTVRSQMGIGTNIHRGLTNSMIVFRT